MSFPIPIDSILPKLRAEYALCIQHGPKNISPIEEFNKAVITYAIRVFLTVLLIGGVAVIIARRK